MLLMLLLYNSDSWLHLAAHRYLVWTPLTALEYSIYQEISFIWKDVRYFPFSLVKIVIYILSLSASLGYVGFSLVKRKGGRPVCSHVTWITQSVRLSTRYKIQEFKVLVQLHSSLLNLRKSERPEKDNRLWNITEPLSSSTLAHFVPARVRFRSLLVFHCHPIRKLFLSRMYLLDKNVLLQFMKRICPNGFMYFFRIFYVQYFSAQLEVLLSPLAPPRP